jgi:hypothetical protein
LTVIVVNNSTTVFQHFVLGWISNKGYENKEKNYQNSRNKSYLLLKIILYNT